MGGFCLISWLGCIRRMVRREGKWRWWEEGHCSSLQEKKKRLTPQNSLWVSERQNRKGCFYRWKEKVRKMLREDATQVLFAQKLAEAQSSRAVCLEYWRFTVTSNLRDRRNQTLATWMWRRSELWTRNERWSNPSCRRLIPPYNSTLRDGLYEKKPKEEHGYS